MLHSHTANLSVLNGLLMSLLDCVFFVIGVQGIHLLLFHFLLGLVAIAAKQSNISLVSNSRDFGGSQLRFEYHFFHLKECDLRQGI